MANAFRAMMLVGMLVLVGGGCVRIPDKIDVNINRYTEGHRDDRPQPSQQPDDDYEEDD